MAKVGRHVILAGELDAAVNRLLEANRDRIPSGQLETQRRLLREKLLEQLIELKLVLVDALRQIPPENLENIEKSLMEQFEETELPKRMEEAGVATRSQLEAKLHQWGTSLEAEKRAFVDRAIAQHRLSEVLRQISENDVPPEQVLAEYQRNIDQYRHKARARWEQLTVLKSKHPDPHEARRLLAMMGNQVIDGVPLAEVAQVYSEEPGAARGGQHDWVTQGSLVSEVLDRAIFALPVGQLSQILEDEEGYHIIRVLERRPAYTTPFVEAQVEIRKRLASQMRKRRLQEYLARLREEIPVWNIYQERSADRRDAAGATPPW